jgi:Transcriptional regulator
MDDPENREKHSVKNERVRSYFIDAARQIILSEGVESVSVRKVADIAGYSYATIYNYFSDLNALLLETKRSMIRDMVAYMGGAQDETAIGIEQIKQLNRMYALYYLAHPHVFRFFYSYRLTEEPKAAAQYFDYTASWQETYQSFVTDGTIKSEDVGIVAKTLIYALHGLLALFFSDNGLSKEALLADLDAMAELILKRRQHS